MRAPTCYTLLAAALTGSALALSPRQAAEPSSPFYAPARSVDLMSDLMSAYVVPLTDGWRYHHPVRYEDRDPGDTLEAQGVTNSSQLLIYPSLVADQPNQAVSFLVPATMYRLSGRVKGVSMDDPAPFSVILDDKVLSPAEYSTKDALLELTSPSNAGSRNLTLVLGPEFKGSLTIFAFTYRTMVDAL
jgi:hypothetical protein